MKRIVVYGLALCAGSSLALVGQPIRAETPSQTDIAGKLYPIPGALQETRGISVGRAAPAATMSHQIRLEAPVRQEAVRHHAVARPAPATGTGILPGCPSTADGADKPSVSLPQITFDFGSAQLRPAAGETLRNPGKALS